MYQIVDEYKGLRVCLPGKVIDLTPEVSQAKLRKLAAINYPGVVWIPDESPEGQADNQQDEVTGGE